MSSTYVSCWFQDVSSRSKDASEAVSSAFAVLLYEPRATARPGCSENISLSTYRGVWSLVTSSVCVCVVDLWVG